RSPVRLQHRFCLEKALEAGTREKERNNQRPSLSSVGSPHDNTAEWLSSTTTLHLGDIPRPRLARAVFSLQGIDLRCWANSLWQGRRYSPPLPQRKRETWQTYARIRTSLAYSSNETELSHRWRERD